MTEKRFTIDDDRIKDNQSPCCYIEYYNGLVPTVDLLNKLNDECEFLEIENEALEDGATKYAELYHKSLKENEQLKQQIEALEFELRTIKAYDRTVKKEHSDSVYDFQKKLEKW